MRGDQKWPPQSVKEAVAAENEARRQLAKGPACRPRKVRHLVLPRYFCTNDIRLSGLQHLSAVADPGFLGDLTRLPRYKGRRHIDYFGVLSPFLSPFGSASAHPNIKLLFRSLPMNIKITTL